MILRRRVVAPMINATLITVFLLYLMYSLVYVDNPELSSPNSVNRFPWPVVREDSEPVMQFIKPERIEVKLAPEVVFDPPVIQLQPISGSDIGPVIFNRKRGSLPQLENSQLVLALGFPPDYPARAISRGIEGYAVVGFSVNELGAVFDAHIIESEPSDFFDRSALKAISKFRYQARTVEGKTVSTAGQRYMFTYKLD